MCPLEVAVDFPSMTDLHDQDEEDLVWYLVDDMVVSDAKAVEDTFLSLQGGNASRAGVVSKRENAWSTRFRSLGGRVASSR